MSHESRVMSQEKLQATSVMTPASCLLSLRLKGAL